MIKQALEYLLSLDAPTAFEINGERWVDKKIYKIRKDYPDSLNSHTLDGLVDYALKYAIVTDNIIHIDNYNSVHIKSILDAHQQRRTLLSARAEVETKSSDQFMSLQNFILKLKTEFVPGDNYNKLLKISSSVSVRDENHIKDDGIQQEVATKRGSTLLEMQELPPTIKLGKICTFPEISQPEREYVFRVEKQGDRANFGLFESKSVGWKLNGINYVYEYLKAKLPDYDIIR